MPIHNETRYHGIKSESDQTNSVLTNNISFSNFSFTVSETYCKFCDNWIQTNGVIGPLKFMAKHLDGDCQIQNNKLNLQV